VFLSCGRFECNIKGIAADEFPIIPTLADRAPSATFAPEALCCAVGQVAFAAANDDTRPILTGVRIALMDRVASFAAADSFRLTFRDIVLDKAVAQAQQVVVPARAMETLGKVMGDVEGEVEMLIDAGDRVLFRAEGVELVSRAIDGRYPDIGKYLGLTFATVLTIDTKALAKAVKLASFFAVASSNIIRLELTPAANGKGTLTLSANAAEVGNNQSIHDAAICGMGGTVALNVRFLADGIDAITTPTVAIHLNSAQQPVVLRGVGDETYAYVAMPMTVR
jgi:DNA polymerase-3 subunit beta